MSSYKKQFNKPENKRMIKRHMKAKAYLDFIKADYRVHNEGEHIVIDQDSLRYRIDFWPSTGTWIVFATKRRGHGVKDLGAQMNRFLKVRLLNANAQTA